MHIRFFFLSSSEEFSKKVALRTEMKAVPIGSVPSVEKRKTIMVFLCDENIND